MRVLIATGGTGGHIYPALALAEYLKAQNNEVLFVGNDDRMEKDLVPEHGFAIKLLHTSGLAGSLKDKITACMQSVKAINQAKKIIKDFNADIVIGFGGYICAPVLLAAQKLNVKTMIHEQNSIVGKANKLVSHKCDAIITCYEQASKMFDNNNVHLLGNPRASQVANYQGDADLKKYFDDDKPIGLVVMGSLGSETINEIMKDVLPEIENINFIYVSGKRDYERTKNMFSCNNVKVVDYVDQLALLKKVDFLICRAGATTCAEICAAGVACIMIPSPYVANNHQYYNAKSLYDLGAVEMIEENNLNKDVVYDKINKVVFDKSKYQIMRKKAYELGKQNACADIYELMKQVIGE